MPPFPRAEHTRTGTPPPWSEQAADAPSAAPAAAPATAVEEPAAGGGDDDPCGWKSIADNSPVTRPEPVAGYWRQNAGELEIMLPFEATRDWNCGPKPHAVLNEGRSVLSIRLPRNLAKGHVTECEKYIIPKRETHIVLRYSVDAIQAESVHHVTDRGMEGGAPRSFLCVLIKKDKGGMWPVLSPTRW